MANKYEDILALVNAGNQMGLSNTIKRDYGIPLDFTSVQATYNDAVIYAATSTLAYVGQTVAVGGKLYIITDVVNGTITVGEGETAKTYNNYLAEVGSKTEGDGKTIELDGQTLKLAGLTGLDTNKTYVPSLVGGKLVWAEPDTSTAEGQQQAIDGLTTRMAAAEADIDALETTINGKPAVSEEGAEDYEPAVIGLTEKVETNTTNIATNTENIGKNTQAIADEKSARETDVNTINEKIGAAAEGETAATGLYAAIETAKAEAIEETLEQISADVSAFVEARENTDDITASAYQTQDGRDIVNFTHQQKLGETFTGTATTSTLGGAEAQTVTISVPKINVNEYGHITDAENVTYTLNLVGTGDAAAAESRAKSYTDEQIATEKSRAEGVEADLQAGLALKADKTALEELAATVDAFLTGDGTEAALDSLKELIAYIESHDDTDIAGILEDIQAIENKLAGIDTTVVAYVTAAINALKIGDYAKAADLTALAERVEALEAKPFDTYATKTEVQNVDAKFANYTTTETLTTQLDAKADANKVVANDTFETFKTTNTAAIEAAQNAAVAAAKTETETQVGALEDAVAATYATQQSLTDLNNSILATLNSYVTEETAEQTYEKIGTAYTKAEVDTKIGTPGTPAIKDEQGNVTQEAVAGTGVYQNVYSKSEVTSLIADITGGESAADVKAMLVEYKTTNDAEVKAIKELNAAQTTAIETAQAQADKGVADAKTANDAILALTTGAVAQNTGDITAIKGRLETLETAKGDHETRIGTAEGKITALEQANTTINTSIGTIEGTLTTLGNKDAELAGLITALQTNKADASSVYTKGETDTQIENAIKAIPAVDLEPYAKTEDVANTYATIAALEAIYKAGEGETAATGVLAKEITRAQAAEKKIADDLALLIENPTEALDSVKELIDHVQKNGTAVEGIITRLDDHDTLLAGIGGENQPANVIAAINAAVATVVTPKASEEVTVATDGTLGLGKVSTDKLEQGELTLVLNGGTASN